MNKALITGGLGFIGYHLSRRLLAEGFEVHAYDNRRRGTIDAQVEALQANSRYRLIIGDLIDEDSLQRLANDYAYIFHMAAIVGVRHVAEQPYQVLTDNVDSLANVIDFARRQTDLRRLVFPSTSEVYAGTLQYFGMSFPTPETTPLAVTDLALPRTSYMLSKIYGEALCQHAGVPFTIVRPHNVYGPRMGMAHVVPELLKRTHQIPTGGKLPVFSANHKRTFCYVDDAVEFIVRLAKASAGLSGTFNIGSSTEEISIARLAELIAATVGKHLEIESAPATQGSTERRQPHLGLAITVTGYNPTVSLHEGILRTYEWYRARGFETAEP
jgi:UDP-glucose 4-epimerase